MLALCFFVPFLFSNVYSHILQQQSGLAPECEALTKDKNGLQEYLEDIYKYNKEQRAVVERTKQLNAEKREISPFLLHKV